MLCRLAMFVALLLFVATSRAAAQSPMTMSGVRDAVVADLRAQRDFDTRTQFVSDSAGLAQFVSCRTSESGRRCVLTDSVPVVLVRVRMLARDSAEVLTGQYQMFYRRCPSRTPIDPPLIAINGNETRTMVYRDGKWVETSDRRRAVC